MVKENGKRGGGERNRQTGRHRDSNAERENDMNEFVP